MSAKSPHLTYITRMNAWNFSSLLKHNSIQCA
jgi:hypothetical protein